MSKYHLQHSHFVIFSLNSTFNHIFNLRHIFLKMWPTKNILNIRNCVSPYMNMTPTSILGGVLENKTLSAANEVAKSIYPSFHYSFGVFMALYIFALPTLCLIGQLIDSFDLSDFFDTFNCFNIKGEVIVYFVLVVYALYVAIGLIIACICAVFAFNGAAIYLYMGEFSVLFVNMGLATLCFCLIVIAPICMFSCIYISVSGIKAFCKQLKKLMCCKSL